MDSLVHALAIDKCFGAKTDVTAQLREVLEQVLDLFETLAEYGLNLMKAEQTLNDVMARFLIKLKPVLQEFKLFFINYQYTVLEISPRLYRHK